MNPILMLLLPMVPQLINAATAIVDAARRDDSVPADTKAALDELAARLAQTVRDVQVLPIRDV